jgi:hypothetical protein
MYFDSRSGLMGKKTRIKSDWLVAAVAQAQAMSGNQARLVLTAVLDAGYLPLKRFEEARALAEHDARAMTFKPAVQPQPQAAE